MPTLNTLARATLTVHRHTQRKNTAYLVRLHKPLSPDPKSRRRQQQQENTVYLLPPKGKCNKKSRNALGVPAGWAIVGDGPGEKVSADYIGGSSTPSMTWITPLAACTSVATTFTLSLSTTPSSVTAMVTSAP
jgi:hypothetical protein